MTAMTYELTNAQRHKFYHRMALFAYERASLMASKDNLKEDELVKIASDLDLAEKELRRCGVIPPASVEHVSRSVNHYRRVANEYCGSWILFEAATDLTIENCDSDMELREFISLCTEVARANDLFLRTALDLAVTESGEVVTV